VSTETQALVSYVRETLGLTQMELGALLGTKAACVSRWESGFTDLSEHKLAVFRLIERAILTAGPDKVREMALRTNANTPEGLIRIVHLGDVRTDRSS
jgi:transcriptional regulator with XRE-family HTH domain